MGLNLEEESEMESLCIIYSCLSCPSLNGALEGCGYYSGMMDTFFVETSDGEIFLGRGPEEAPRRM